MEFSVNNIQLVLFISDPSETNYERLSLTIKDALDSKFKFSGPAMFFPEAPGLPPEIPRMVLQSVCEEFKFQLSRQRVDVIVSGSNIPNEKNIFKTIFEILSQAKIRTNRVGYNKHYKSNNTNTEEHLRKLLSPKIKNAEEIFIRYNIKGLQKELNISTNNITSIATEVTPEGKNIRLSFDYNSSPEQDIIFFEKDFVTFLNSSEKETSPQGIINLIEEEK